MNKLQVLIDAGGGPPDFRGQLVPPVVVAGDAFAITGQVERGAALPVGTEHRAEPPALAARPAR